MPNSLLQQGSLLLISGLDVSKPSEYIGEQSSPNVVNFRVARSLLKKRGGVVQRGDVIAGTNIEIMHGREFTREASKYNIRISRDTVERYNVGTAAWVDITGTALTGTTFDLIDTAVPLLSGNTILCITNGIDSIRKWTSSGNTANLGGSPPKAKFIQEFNSYLVCANITGGVDISQRVQWCDTGDPEEWADGNAGFVDLIDDGEDITGLSLFGGNICIHKKTAIYLGTLISTNEIFRFDRKNTEIGTVANGSIVNLPTGEQIFLALDGLHVFNGAYAPLIESPINDEIREIINPPYASKAWGLLVPEEKEVWIGIPTGSETVGNIVYKFNYVTRVLYKDTRAHINCAWRATQTEELTWDEMDFPWDSVESRWDGSQLGEDAPLINFGSDDGYTYYQSFGVTGDDGEEIDAVWESKDYQDLEHIGRMLRWQEIRLWIRGSGTITVEYSTDEGETWTEVSGSPFTLTEAFPNDVNPMIGYFDVVSTKVRFRFRNNTSTDSIDVKQFMVGYLKREQTSG